MKNWRPSAVKIKDFKCVKIEDFKALDDTKTVKKRK